MRDMNDNSDKNKLITFFKISIFLVLSGIFLFLFVVCLINYIKISRINYSDLRYEELTFEEYMKTVHVYARGTRSYTNEIYFEEYEEPFLINSVTMQVVNERDLESIEYHTSIEVYYLEKLSEKYKYNICEMQSEATVFF